MGEYPEETHLSDLVTKSTNPGRNGERRSFYHSASRTVASGFCINTIMQQEYYVKYIQIV